MAIDLSRLAGDWTFAKEIRLFPGAGTGPMADVSNRRLAIGFSYAGVKLIKLMPVVHGDGDFAFYLQGPGERWFWWHRYATLVMQAWTFSNITGGIDSITVLQTLQTENRG